METTNVKQSHQNNPDHLDQLSHRWPSAFVAREKIGDFTGGLISPKTMANYDSAGTGPVRVAIGRKVAYPVDSLVSWLKGRVKGGE